MAKVKAEVNDPRSQRVTRDAGRVTGPRESQRFLGFVSRFHFFFRFEIFGGLEFCRENQKRRKENGKSVGKKCAERRTDGHINPHSAGAGTSVGSLATRRFSGFPRGTSSESDSLFFFLGGGVSDSEPLQLVKEAGLKNPGRLGICLSSPCLSEAAEDKLDFKTSEWKQRPGRPPGSSRWCRPASVSDISTAAAARGQRVKVENEKVEFALRRLLLDGLVCLPNTCLECCCCCCCCDGR